MKTDSKRQVKNKFSGVLELTSTPEGGMICCWNFKSEVEHLNSVKIRTNHNIKQYILTEAGDGDMVMMICVSVFMGDFWDKNVLDWLTFLWFQILNTVTFNCSILIYCINQSHKVFQGFYIQLPVHVFCGKEDELISVLSG